MSTTTNGKKRSVCEKKPIKNTLSPNFFYLYQDEEENTFVTFLILFFSLGHLKNF